MTEPVADLPARVVDENSDELLRSAFVGAERREAAEEARGHLRDGLIDVPLPFDAARRLGSDADDLVRRAAALADRRAAQLLREFAARVDRADIGGMGWRASDRGGLAYSWRSR